MKFHTSFLIVLAGIFAVSGEAFSQDSDSPLQVIDDSTVAIGGVTVNSRSHTARAHGKVNLTQGLMEYLAVAPGGKTHEAVLTLEVRPLHIQLALLLLGLDYGSNLRFQGDSLPPVGDSVAITVSWLDSTGESVSVPAAHLLRRAQGEEAMSATHWVFTGSTIWNGRFMADEDGSIVATYSDPVAVLNNPLETRLDDMLLEANNGILPPVGTEVIMTFQTVELK